MTTKLKFLCGPCVIESRAFARETAEQLRDRLMARADAPRPAANLRH
ncbi:MAG: hypothetical protein ACREYA_00915 [Cupriavidus necator]